MKKSQFSIKKLFIFMLILNIGYITFQLLKNAVIKEIIVLDWAKKKFTDSDLAPLSKYFMNCRFKIENSKITGTGFNSVRSLCYLERLELTKNEINDEGMMYISKLKKLTELTINEEAFITDEGFLYLKNLKNLKKLSLSKTKITDAGLVAIQELTSLTELYLDETHITDDGLKYLGNLSNLYILCLNKTNITDEGLPYLKKLKNLGILLLRSTHVTDNGMHHLIPMQNLRVLSLLDTQITTTSLLYLKELKNISEIEFNCGKLFDKDPKEIFPHYRKFVYKWKNWYCGTGMEIDRSIRLTLVTDKTGIVRSGLFRPAWWEHYSYKFFGLKYSW